MTQSSCNN